MGALFSFLLGLANRTVLLKSAELGFQSALELAKFVAWKAVIFTILFTGIQVVASLVLYDFMSTVFTYATDKLGEVTQQGDFNFVIQATGLMAYFVDILRIDDAFQIVVGAVMTKFTLKTIPFFRF